MSTLPCLTPREHYQIQACHDAVVLAERSAGGPLGFIRRGRVRWARAEERGLLDLLDIRNYDAYLLATRLARPRSSRAQLISVTGTDEAAKTTTARRCTHCFVVEELQHCATCGRPACRNCLASVPSPRPHLLCVPCALVAGGIRVRPDRAMRQSA